MPYVYLVVAFFFFAANNIIGTIFNRKNETMCAATPLYNFLVLISVFATWTILFLMDGTYDMAVLPYAVVFALCYTLSMVGIIYALKYGSVMLTSLLSQFSLILVSVWGFFFWDTEFSWLVGVGLVLTAVALWLCLYKGKGAEQTKSGVKWLIFILIQMVGNAGCAITQRTQQMDFDGQYGNFLMMAASGLSAVVCLGLYLCSDRRDTKAIVRSSWPLPVLAGVLNAVVNLLVILMAATTLSPSLIYPSIAIGSLTVILIASLFVFKEKMRWWQWLGVLLGIAATGILSL